MRGFRRFLKWTLGGLALIAALVWTGDWLLLRHTAAVDGPAFGEVEVHYRYAIRQKNKRIEQSSAKPMIVGCVHSMFPHYDETPCWYLVRHTEQTLSLDGSPWHFYYEDE